MTEDDLVGVAQRRKHVRRLLVGEGVEAAAKRLDTRPAAVLQERESRVTPAVQVVV
jgi:hypothetical protein